MRFSLTALPFFGIQSAFNVIPAFSVFTLTWLPVIKSRDEMKKVILLSFFNQRKYVPALPCENVKKR